ncbi:GNAT family N-acetyltransferase [Citricoccus sp. NR2]|uniref:GNAT family N-acetyltransferase n=1 Tax=Citricoccus sp. NR2 TaxID=3004095 RepID=UPI0022DE5087|nr:GNAT family N-acetyltransferase [Citricoccus sp. NR2]WBL18850.1 GNAT family N-acetyltransferase [Citricoccus sp. NR2]
MNHQTSHQPLDLRFGGVTVRDAAEADFEAIAALTYASYVEAGHIPADDDYVAQLLDVPARAQGPGRLVVAELDGAVAGSTVLLTGEMDMAEVAHPGEFEFRMLGVAPAFQRRGVGRALVATAENHARALGCSAIVITTMASMTDAHQLYRACGFERRPDRDWSLGERGWLEPGERDETFLAFVHPLAPRD